MVDHSEQALKSGSDRMQEMGLAHVPICMDVLEPRSQQTLLEHLLEISASPTALINNVAANPPMRHRDNHHQFAIDSSLMADLQLSLEVASRFGLFFGDYFAKSGAGVIVNVASDLALVGPDQRIYANPNDPSDHPKKPVSYSVSKAGLLGLTRYLATYWAPVPVRCNALAPGSVLSSQDSVLVRNLEERIPLGRLASESEYQGAIVFLLSEASSYMTGSILTIDGGRTSW